MVLWRGRKYTNFGRVVLLHHSHTILSQCKEEDGGNCNKDEGGSVGGGVREGGGAGEPRGQRAGNCLFDGWNIN